ncbi:thioesterase domain-containing protein [Streptomyces sp. NPDC020996]|uniref:acyl carrier protein n=1 Tax=Streptomyces sp. NPDC020996 TaxID=3154791 RepID=UPI0033DF6BE9
MTGTAGGLPERATTYAVETLLRSVWSEHFGHPVGPDDDFYELGGDSLAVVEIVLAARARGLPLRTSDALRQSTPARLAEALTVGRAARVPERLLSLVTDAAAGPWPRAGTPRPDGQGGAEGLPLFTVHSDSHRRAERAALREWGLGRPVRGFGLPGLDGSVTDARDVPPAARALAESVGAEQPDGPLALAGFGPGAVLAFEAARALRAAGREIALLALVSPPAPAGAASRAELLSARTAALAARFGLGEADGPEALLPAAHAAGWFEDVDSAAELVRRQAAGAAVAFALAGHRLDGDAFDGPVLLAVDAAEQAAVEQAWGPVLSAPEVCRLDHGLASPAGALRDPRLAEALRKGCVA